MEISSTKSNRMQKHGERTPYHDQVGFIPVMQEMSSIRKSTNVTHHNNITKGEKTEMIV